MYKGGQAGRKTRGQEMCGGETSTVVGQETRGGWYHITAVTHNTGQFSFSICRYQDIILKFLKSVYCRQIQCYGTVFGNNPTCGNDMLFKRWYKPQQNVSSALFISVIMFNCTCDLTVDTINTKAPLSVYGMA